MRGIHIPLASFVVIVALASCGESEETVEPQKTIILNGQEVKLSQTDFSTLQTIVGGSDEKTCFADPLRDFFATQSIDFDSQKFALEISNGGKLEIVYRAPNCMKMETMGR
jgi:hypothetical protein